MHKLLKKPVSCVVELARMLGATADLGLGNRPDARRERMEFLVDWLANSVRG